MLLAETLRDAATMDVTAWVDTVIKLVTAGGFGALVWYLIVKHIPAIHDQYREERTANLVAMEKRYSEFTEVIKEFRNEITELREEITALKAELRGRNTS